MYSGLALLSWVAAFGIAGPLLPRLHLSSRLAPLVAPIGYLLLTSAYAGVSLSLFTGHFGDALVFVLLGLGGLGLGTGFAPMVAHITSSVPNGYAPDMSGLITTTSQVSAVIGVATFGTAYLNMATGTDSQAATHAFALTTAGFALAALLAMAASYISTQHHAPVKSLNHTYSRMDKRTVAVRRAD